MRELLVAAVLAAFGGGPALGQDVSGDFHAQVAEALRAAKGSAARWTAGRGAAEEAMRRRGREQAQVSMDNIDDQLKAVEAEAAEINRLGLDAAGVSLMMREGPDSLANPWDFTAFHEKRLEALARESARADQEAAEAPGRLEALPSPFARHREAFKDVAEARAALLRAEVKEAKERVTFLKASRGASQRALSMLRLSVLDAAKRWLFAKRRLCEALASS